VWSAEPHEQAPALPTLLDRLLESADPAWYEALASALEGGELPSEEQLVFRLPQAEDLDDLAPLEREAQADADAPIDAAAAVAQRERARLESSRPWSASPSQLAADDDEPFRASGYSLGRKAGSALHRALERWEFGAQPRAELERLARAEPEARELLERFVRGPLFERFLAAGRTRVARELAFVARPEAGEASCAVSGSIDLVYRDPDGRLVVADYKSDALAGEEAIDERAAHHAPQVKAYARALARALPGEREPRAELWFLQPGLVRTIP
jgi:ATP-dependent exoDNAse (exonuclease V) beta subunit